MATVAGGQAAKVFASPSFTQRRATFSNSYSTGGESVPFAALGLGTVYCAICTITSASAGAVVEVRYDVANQKLQAFTATAEVAGAVNLSGVTVDILAIGRA